MFIVVVTFRVTQNLLNHHVVGNGDLRRESFLPYHVAFLRARYREVDDALQAANEGCIDVGPLVGRQYHQPVIAFNAPQQVMRPPLHCMHGWGVCRIAINRAARIGPIAGICRSNLVARCFRLSAKSSRRTARRDVVPRFAMPPSLVQLVLVCVQSFNTLSIKKSSDSQRSDSPGSNPKWSLRDHAGKPAAPGSPLC